MDLIAHLKEFQRHFRMEIRDAALRLLPEGMPSVTEELFGLYEKNGNRIIYEKVYFARRRFLAVLGLEAIAQKEGYGIWKEGFREDAPEEIDDQILKKLASVIEDICTEECWALPPHVNRKEEGWQTTVDLFAAETAQTMAELSHRLEGELPAHVSENIKYNVERRVFLPFFTSEVPYRNWEHGMHNWNGVCAGAVGSACIHLMRDKERLKKSLRRICEGLQYYMKGFEDDGACTEGLGYYTYGMGYFANFAQELYDLTQKERDLFRGEWGEFSAEDKDKRTKIAEFERKCFFGDGRTISFADGNSRGKFRVGLSCILAMHYPDFSFPAFCGAAGLDTNGCYHFAELKSDLLMPDRLINIICRNELMSEEKTKCEGQINYMDEEGGEDGKAVHILPSAQWVIACSQAGIGMACKGGHNMEFHNHNDVGHFIYEGAGIMFFTDLGAGEYRKGYFGEGRYEVFCNRSLGHSVPLVNGKEQPAGREYACSGFEAEENSDSLIVKMDLAGAYEKNMVKSLRRRLEFNLKSGGLQVQDEICMHRDMEKEPIEKRAEGFTKDFRESLTENLVTQIEPVVAGDRVLLPYDKWICILSPPNGEEIHITEYEHSNHKGVGEKVYAIQWNVRLKDGQGRSNFSICLEKMNDK